MMEWFLLTGQPQTGKTTVINKTIENINEEFKDKYTELEIHGFLTDEKVNKKKWPTNRVRSKNHSR